MEELSGESLGLHDVLSEAGAETAAKALRLTELEAETTQQQKQLAQARPCLFFNGSVKAMTGLARMVEELPVLSYWKVRTCDASLVAFYDSCTSPPSTCSWL